MSTPEHPASAPTGTEPPYDVVVLVEEDVSPGDAARLTSLHEGLDTEVRYHLLLPVDDAAARVHSAMGSFAAGEPLAAPVASPEEERALVEAEHTVASRHLASSLEAMRAAGATVDGAATDEHPVDALRRVVADRGADEAIVLTSRHVVAEFLHVDWASRAERHLGIPVLHLVEHESFSEQAGDAGGISGL
ncbi:hypothetical protein GCM10009737_18100 [Nocardioides lentus]|uniref:Universal stress protein n=1 Tax=Nocardioides lentus TaxID=338077 RepID=A0ABN2PCN3_9ACTN